MTTVSLAPGVFTRGSVLRHLLVMSSANTLSLLALVASDLIDMYFLSQLGQQELAAAIGFAGIILFFLVSVGLGLQIAMGALVARAEGSHDRASARRLCTHTLLASVVGTALVTVPAWIFAKPLLALLGARGETLELAHEYAAIVIPTTPLLICGMCAAAALRAIGDARQSILITLLAAVTTVVLDPVFILGMEMGIQGAALAAFCARSILAVAGLMVLIKLHRFLVPVNLQRFRADVRDIFRIAGPALMTTLATPLGSSYVVHSMAEYGESAVAGAATLGRIIPVVFAAIFGLSSAIGPIVGQNAYGGQYDRVKRVLRVGVLLNGIYVLAMWVAFYLSHQVLIDLFDASGIAAQLIRFYATWLVGAFCFAGVLIIALASFNNLGLAILATQFNIARVALGVVPLVMVGSALFGAIGVMLGETGAVVIWGSLAYVALIRKVDQLAQRHEELQPVVAYVPDAGSMAYSSGVSQLERALEGTEYRSNRGCE